VARGWESKSVEDQISERQDQAKPPDSRRLDPRELERKSKREGILLVRTRTLAALEITQDERYRTLLNRTLAHLDAELEKLA
jgi:hypothetical protein